jgi:hypothetical protein
VSLWQWCVNQHGCRKEAPYRFKSAGSLVIFAAMRRASFIVSTFIVLASVGGGHAASKHGGFEGLLRTAASIA